MRVLMISKACIAGAYQKKLEEIASRGVDLTVIVPPYWRDDAGRRGAFGTKAHQWISPC